MSLMALAHAVNAALGKNKMPRIENTEELLKLYYECAESEIFSNESGWVEGWSEDKALAELRNTVSEFAVRFNIKNPADN